MSERLSGVQKVVRRLFTGLCALVAVLTAVAVVTTWYHETPLGGGTAFLASCALLFEDRAADDVENDPLARDRIDHCDLHGALAVDETGREGLANSQQRA